MTIKKIIITGNHHTHAIELINQLIQDRHINWQVNYLSHDFAAETHLTQTIIPNYQPSFYQLTSGKINRNSFVATILGLPLTIKAIFTSLFLIKQIKPDIIVSFGGYTSVPVIIAAYLSRVPAISHEQTLTLSLSNQINRFFVKYLALSFPLKNSPPNSVVTGNLLRSQIFLTTTQNFSSLKLNSYPLLYITGGSQGSQTINRLVGQLLPRLLPHFTIIHQTGHKTVAEFHHPRYLSPAYVGQADIGWVLHQATLIIGRAGANFCQEIATLQKKSILIPLPQSQQDEQLLNALWLKKQLPQTTIIIPENQLTPSALLTAVNQLKIIKTPPLTITPKLNLKLLRLIHRLV